MRSNMLMLILQLWYFTLLLSELPFAACKATVPYAMRISCGARQNVKTQPTNTLWHKDFAYTGGVPTNATLPSIITPPLKTLRYFPLSGGPNNCYSIYRVPSGHYQVRVFFGLVAHSSFDQEEPLFDVSVEGTQIYSLKSGWSSHQDQVFTEALVFLTDGTASICFHSTGHGDPAILSIEILQVHNKGYYFGPNLGPGTILRTVTRLNFGAGKPVFDADYNGDRWGGDRFWTPKTYFGRKDDEPRRTGSKIKQASNAPNFYPEALYRKAIASTDRRPDLEYIMDVDPNRNYSVWLHFAEIDSSVTGIGKRVFDILLNGDMVFSDVDIVKMSGGRYAALVLNKTVTVSGRTLSISLQPKNGSHAIISAIEVFEIIPAEARTLREEVRVLQKLRNSLGLPHRLGWNGDPCVPQQHPWSGADCQFDRTSSRWCIDGLALDNQGLRGFLPNYISKLRHLQSINLSGNSIHGAIPSSLGTITKLRVLDLSYNFLNGTIPESLGMLTSLRLLNLNGNSLSGKVPVGLGGRLLHGASFNFTDNAGLCGIPGLRMCGPHLSAGTIVGIALGACVALLLVVGCSFIWWKRKQNILRAKRLAERGPAYAKARTQSYDIQMTRHHSISRTASDNGPSLLS